MRILNIIFRPISNKALAISGRIKLCKDLRTKCFIFSIAIERELCSKAIFDLKTVSVPQIFFSVHIVIYFVATFEIKGYKQPT